MSSSSHFAPKLGSRYENLNEALSDGLAHHHEYNRHGAGRFPQRHHRRGAMGKYYFRLKPYQFLHRGLTLFYCAY
jgi:hypothetical protein